MATPPTKQDPITALTSSPGASASTGPSLFAQTQCTAESSLIKDTTPVLSSVIGGLIAFAIAWWTTNRAEKTRTEREAIEAQRDLYSRAAIVTSDLVNLTVRFSDIAPSEIDKSDQAIFERTIDAGRELEFLFKFIIDGPDELFKSLTRAHRETIAIGFQRISLHKKLAAISNPLDNLSQLHQLDKGEIQRSLQATHEEIGEVLTRLSDSEEALLAWIKEEMKNRGIWPPKPAR